MFSRIVSIHLYIHKKVRELLNLSAKHLFANVKEKLANGNLKSYKGLEAFLKTEGLVLEQACKCKVGKNKKVSTDACDKIKVRKFFLTRLITRLSYSKANNFANISGQKKPSRSLISLL